MFDGYGVSYSCKKLCLRCSNGFWIICLWDRRTSHLQNEHSNKNLKEIITYLSFLVFPIFFQHFFPFFAWSYSCPKKILQTLPSSCQSSINLSLSESLAFLVAILITCELIWFIEMYYFWNSTFFFPRRIRFIHFHFQLVEKFGHQLIEINFRFVENVKCSVITLHNFLISRNRIQLNG